jgi:hypothetical protein
MTLNDLYLVMLMEECAEVAHRASKQLRFGADEIQPGQPDTNRFRLRDEIMDLIVIVEKLQERQQIKYIGSADMTNHSHSKRDKVEKMLQLSRRMGCLESET